VEFGKARSIASDAAANARAEQAILVEATPAKIAEIVSGLDKDSAQIAAVAVRAGTSQRELLAAAGVPLQETGTQRLGPDKTAVADAGQGKLTLRPQAATAEKAASQDSEGNGAAATASGQPLKLSASEVLRLFQTSQASEEPGNRQSDGGNTGSKAGGSPTTRIRVIFVTRNSEEGQP
jgi:hypothetical protein